MIFELDKEQTNKFLMWNKSHKCKFRDNYEGAIGGRLTFSFTQTSLGIITTIECTCGEKIDVTDYEVW